MPTRTTITRYAIARFYVPFTMGGDVWQVKCFQVPADADEVRLAGGLHGFIARVGGCVRVYESVSGGQLGKGSTRSAAIKSANANIRRTPDLKKQIKKAGAATEHPEISFREAESRLQQAADR